MCVCIYIYIYVCVCILLMYNVCSSSFIRYVNIIFSKASVCTERNSLKDSISMDQTVDTYFFRIVNGQINVHLGSVKYYLKS